MADLVLAVQERLEENGVSMAERRALTAMHAHLKAWRRDPSLVFESRAIIVATRRPRKSTGEMDAATHGPTRRPRTRTPR